MKLLKLRLSLLILLHLASLINLQAEHYNIFVLTGQSNSLGVTNGGEPDPTSGFDAADDKVLFAWRNVVGDNNVIGHSGETLSPTKLTADFTTYKDQQGGVYSGSTTHWGPETEFIRTLKRAGVDNIGVIKVSRGGGGNGFWHKPNADRHMYDYITNTVSEATASLTAAGHTFDIIGLLYLQGESNSTSEATVAGTRFKTLVDNLRVDLPNASAMHGVIGGIAAASTTRDTTRANHAAIATSTSYIDFFSTLDQQVNLHDSLHYNRAAKIIVGNRFAHGFLSAGIVDHHYGNLVFIGDSITQGGNGNHPSYRYQIFKNLANQNVAISTTAGYKFVGSVAGPYQNSALTTPTVNGQAFENNHDGHWGWRAFWENGRVALPSSRRSSNRGEGTILNWTNQASPQEYDLNSLGTKVAYPDPGASGSGNTGVTYTPDTASILIGINDIAGGNSAATVRDDIGLMIDQLQAANPNVSIFINQTLHTNQTFNATVDTLNALLPALAQSKTTSTSCVWVIETNSGFDPVTQTYDNVHPNADGEEYVGDRVSGGMGVIEMPQPASVSSPPPIIEKAVTSFPVIFEGNEIYDGASYINGWTEVTAGGTAETLNGTDLNRDHSGNTGGGWLQGTTSTKDGGATTWDTANDGSWTIEVRLKFLANPSGMTLLAETGTKAVQINLYGDRTESNTGKFSVNHDNLDSQYHTWRVANDAPNEKYHVWRDGERLTPVDGVDYDNTINRSLFMLGDPTSAALGNNYNMDIDYIAYDQTGAFLPTDADTDNDGLPDSWEYLYFGDVVSGVPGEDPDGDGASNEDEYIADTDPTEKDSVLRIESIVETSPGNFTITVPDTSPQRNYTLYATTDMGTTDPWTVIGIAKIGTDGDLTYDHASSDAKRFYRVKATQP